MRLAAFTGRWLLERDIQDLHTGQTGTFVGQGRFEPDADGLAYCESGEMRLGASAPMLAERRYHWSDGGDGSIVVRFGDGRFFHRFYADELEPTAAHDCAPDRYRVRYDFTRLPAWRAEWRAQGPRKHYVTLTTFRPAGQTGAHQA